MDGSGNIPTGVGTLRRSEAHVEFVDQYGDRRVIHRTKGTRLSVKRDGNTPVHAMNRAAAILIGRKIREHRLSAGMTLAELGVRAGLAAAPGGMKQRVRELEVGERREGMRFGTLYALAIALGISVGDLMPTADEVREASGVSFRATEGLSV